MGSLFWTMVLVSVASQAADATRHNDDELNVQEAQIEISKIMEKYMHHWPLKRSSTDIVNWPLPGSSLLGATALDPKRLRELREGLANFREFRLRLSQSEEHTFAKLCTQTRGRPHTVSCGDTMDCFMYFFFSYHHFGHLLSGPTKKQRDAALAVYGDTSDEVEHMLALNDWNSIMSSFTHREVVRSLSRVPLDELTATLLREDKEADLPRMFSVYLQWNFLRHDVHVDVSTNEFLKRILTWALKQQASQLDKEEFREYQELWDLFQDPPKFALTMLDHWKSHIMVALRQLMEKPETPATVVLKGLAAPKEPLTFQLSRERVNKFCKNQWIQMNSLVSREVPSEAAGNLRNFSEECANVLKVGSKKVWEHEKDNFQNHIFAIVKRHNDDFSIVQGYIGEQGYDLSGWVRSKNKFASPSGFDSAIMRQFLRHLSTFVENGAGGTFNGDNHYATFDHFEPTFHGNSYRPLFSFSEALATNLRDGSGLVVRESLIKPLIEEMDRCNCSTVEWPLHQLHQAKNHALRTTSFSTWMCLFGSIALAIRPFV
eukprot:CAMPEP_0172831526 /NCGR_PEP_ID=MMETSP1075-20121228/23035_1 /TAXON_ID=2916 /ORGANISM="Ceratium fusus, Strain PA161109" /LENGTH=544 /DNA_ID=CAMNT_0013674011 /DNA_START=71 /DNA_END=1705 /DNA_ORIENTATION=-